MWHCILTDQTSARYLNIYVNALNYALIKLLLNKHSTILYIRTIKMRLPEMTTNKMYETKLLKACRKSCTDVLWLNWWTRHNSKTQVANCNNMLKPCESYILCYSKVYLHFTVINCSFLCRTILILLPFICSMQLWAG